MNAMFVKYAGPLTRLITSQTTSSSTSAPAIAGITYEPTVRLARTGAAATLVAKWGFQRHTGGGKASPGAITACVVVLPDQARLRDDGLDRDEQLAGLLVDRHRERIRVAAGTDREVAEHTARDVQTEHGPRDRSTITAVCSDGLHGDEHRLRAVRGVRVRNRADRLPEALHERCTETREGLRRLARDADVRAVADRAVRVRIGEAVRHLQLDLGVHGLEVLHQLRAVVARDAAEEDRLCPRGLDRVRQCLVARRLRIPALEADDLDPELRRGLLIRARDAEAVGLLVVEDEHLLVALSLRPDRIRRALDVVGGDDAGIVAGAGRVVLLRLTRIPLLREAGVGVRRADHQHRARMGPGQDRHLDLGAAGVERPDGRHDRRVGREEAGPRRA